MSTIEMSNPDYSGNETVTEIREVIVVKVGAEAGVSVSDAAKICRQVAKVMSQLISNVLSEAAAKGSPGAAHPGTQQMFSALANVDAAALTFDPPRVMPPGMGPGGRPGGGMTMGRA